MSRPNLVLTNLRGVPCTALSVDVARGRAAAHRRLPYGHTREQNSRYFEPPAVVEGYLLYYPILPEPLSYLFKPDSCILC